MAKPKSKDKDKKAGKKKKKGHSRMLTFLLLLLPAALVVLPTTMIFGVGMIPTMVAYMIDRDPEKPAPIIVGGLNFCGCMPFAILLWIQGHTMGVAMKMLANPITWLVMYGAAALGWAFYYGIPPAVANAEIRSAEKRVEELRMRKSELVQQWGPEVAGDAFEGGDEGEKAEDGTEKEQPA